MAKLMNEENRDRLLTVRWNNVLAAGLGLATLIYAAIALPSSALSDRAAFFGLVLVGAVY